jgi:hypothetical protein
VLTGIALRLPGVDHVEIHCDQANAASAAVARKLGYRLDRIQDDEQDAPAKSGKRMIRPMNSRPPRPILQTVRPTKGSGPDSLATASGCTSLDGDA